ncbi:meteorin isoform X1 [Strigops habroptila]|uniref:Meteorin, glial cell differentiation regulator n=1 Tax=Strigops habroptila TaxID=2489341 RepID=A0A672TRV7_STRHB|nr:meteorin isoform X1 [Strigops habroptila]
MGCLGEMGWEGPHHLGGRAGGPHEPACPGDGGAMPRSGLLQEAGSVEQLSLPCAEGSLEWLYPTGALRLRLAPRLPPATAAATGGSPQHITACVKPAGTFRGAQLYLERDGVLELLLPEAPRPRVRCFSWAPQEKVALFLQATPHRDISRRIAAFRYELRGDWLARPALPATSLTGEGACRPCNDTEILMAICTSDFVIRGSIRSVSNDVELQESIIGVSAARIHRQKFPLFQAGGRPAGSIRTPLRCGVRPGPGTFLFTGWLHFGEAWLSCAPRYRDFQRIYQGAQRARQNPCEFPMD